MKMENAFVKILDHSRQIIANAINKMNQ